MPRRACAFPPGHAMLPPIPPCTVTRLAESLPLQEDNSANNAPAWLPTVQIQKHPCAATVQQQNSLSGLSASFPSVLAQRGVPT